MRIGPNAKQHRFFPSMGMANHTLIEMYRIRFPTCPSGSSPRASAIM